MLRAPGEPPIAMSADVSIAAADRSTARGIALLLSAIILFGLMDTLGKHLTQSLPVLQVIWGRYVFHLAFLLPFLLRTDPLQLFRTERLGLQVFRSIMLFGSSSLFILSISLMPLAEASSISAVSPLIVTALSVFVLGEKVGLRRWAAVLVGFAGVLIIIRPGPNVINPWAFLPIINAFCFATYTLTTRSLNSTDAPATSLFYSAFTGAILISAAAPFVWQPMELWEWFKMIALGLIGGLSHLLLIRAYEHTQASVLSPFSYTQIVWTSFLGYVAFGDLPDGWTMTGAAIVSGAGIYVFYREAVRRRAAT